MPSQTSHGETSLPIEKLGEQELSSSTNQSGIHAQPAARPLPSTKWKLWTGRVLSTLAILFLLFDAAGKFMMPAPVVYAFTRLGFPASLGISLGILLSTCTILYAIPRTAVLGAILLTGYLGGAVAIHMRAGSTPFETVFPVIFGIVIWAGILLRECRLRQIFPIRR